MTRKIIDHKAQPATASATPKPDATKTPRPRTKPIAASAAALKKAASANSKASTRQAAVASKAPAMPSPAPQTRESKKSQLIASLRPAPGITIEQMMMLTGWQPHTVRAVISACLRKKLGLNVVCEPAGADGQRLYRIQTGA